MEITIKYTKKGETFNIHQNLNKGQNVYDLVSVLEMISGQLKELTGKYLAEKHPGLTEQDKYHLSRKITVEQLKEK